MVVVGSDRQTLESSSMCGIFLSARATDVDVDFNNWSQKLQVANAARGVVRSDVLWTA